MPDEGAGAAGVRVDREGRRVLLGHDAAVRYRIEPLAPGAVRLVAVAGGAGRLEAAWVVIEPVTGAELPGETWEIELEQPGPVEQSFPLPGTESLLELRLEWRASDGRAELELRELALRESTPVERPSILLIVIDTLSARHLSLYGYPLETDPELKRFASESVLFERCLANAPWTLPSFMSLMTGLHARSHELVPAGEELWERWYLAQNRWTLAECLRAAGYRTAGFVDTLWLTEKFGLTQGFDVFDAGAALDSFATHDDPDGGIRKTTAQARAFLDGLGAKTPFFLFVHAFDVHFPYTAEPETPARGVEPYDLERTAPAGGSTWAFGIVPTMVARVEAPEGDLPNPIHVAPIERAYDDGIRFVDEELGKFFAYLRTAGVLERSWVVVTADHGETMSDSPHLFGHGLLVPDVMHVPLVVRPPGGLAHGKRIAETVQLADLYPTLIELAGLERRSDQLHGSSLAPLLRGERRAPAVVLAESGIMRQAMLVDGGWKLLELEPAAESVPDSLLTYPVIGPAWLAEVETARLGRHTPAASRKPLRRASASRGVAPLAWKDDVELQRDLFERMPVVGPTEELLDRMATREGYQSLLVFLRRALRGPFYELYDLDGDPRASRNVAAEHPEKLAELVALLVREKERRTEAWKRARPVEKVELSSEDVRNLEALGYGGAADE